MDDPSNPNLDCLPIEIIHKICLYLDVESIKRFSLTSTRYANIIADSLALVKNFKLKLTSGFWSFAYILKSQVLSLKRKYSTIEITDAVSDSHCALSEIIQKFGQHLRTLVILNSTIDDFTFLTVLRCSSFLEKLCLSDVVIEQKLPAINPISIVHLMSVEVNHTNWLIFKFLTRSQITSLKINNYFNEGDGTRTHLVRMLSNQYRLNELILHGTSSKTLFRDNDLNSAWNFRLSKFHISCGFGRNSDAVDSNIVNFLILNSESLTHVQISMPNCDQIAVVTLLNLSNVTSLTMDVGGLPKDSTFYQTLVGTDPNHHLEHLKLSGFFGQLDDFVKAILSKYPAITNLELDDWNETTSERNMLKFVATKIPNLRKLFIPEISNNADELSFMSLKQLHVSYIRNVQNLINFIRENRSIEILKIGLVYIEQIPLIGTLFELMDLTQVQHLSLVGSVKSLQMIVQLVEKNTPQVLKTLELLPLPHESYSNFSSNSRKSIKIHFPYSAKGVRNSLEAFLQ